ncbi:Plasma membrane t-SNARE, secretory vesicle fusion [Globomyces sp. JEL0801]|nr:Plasma membrane t-SNARE, secretory vesicle fusion [Globomyces sp. JEL0801]
MSGRDRLGELGQNSSFGNNVFGFFVNQKIADLLKSIDRIELNITDISRLHERALVGVSQDETNRLTAQIDRLSDETNEAMNDVRFNLKKLADDTNRTGGSEAQARKAQQSSVAMKLQSAVKRFGQIQKSAKDQYKRRMEREIRIARPDASDADVQRAVEDSRGGSVFAQQMLNSRVGAQRRVLEEVQGRHEELRKLEQSIEELATLFMDMQNLLQQQQEVINVIDTQVENTAAHIEDGGAEIKRAISIRKSSRKKLWYISAFILVLLAIIAVYLYMQRCSLLGFCDKNEKKP